MPGRGRVGDHITISFFAELIGIALLELLMFNLPSFGTSCDLCQYVVAV